MTDLEEIKHRLLSRKAILIDVREKYEWDNGHIPGALHLPLSQLGPATIPESLPRNITLYLFCMKGGRAIQAASILKLYYADVVPLQCTFEELSKADIRVPEIA